MGFKINHPHAFGGHILGKRSGCGDDTDWYLFNIDSGLIAGGNVTCHGIAPAELNVWFHVALAARPDSAIFYINGVRVDSRPCGDFNGNTADLLFGRVGTCEGSFRGMLDEVRFWAVARTAEEISENYLCKVDPATPGLVGYWNFDEDEFDQNVLDQSAFGNNGTLGDDGSVEPEDPARVISPISLCPVAAPELAVAPVAFKVEPNPIMNTAEFSFGSGFGSATIEIYDLQGRLIQMLVPKDGRAVWVLDPSVPRGVYFARLRGTAVPEVVKFAVIR